MKGKKQYTIPILTDDKRRKLNHQTHAQLSSKQSKPIMSESPIGPNEEDDGDDSFLDDSENEEYDDISSSDSSDNDKREQFSDESETEIVSSDNFEEIVEKIKKKTLEKIIEQHKVEQSKLYEKFVETTTSFRKESNDLLRDMALFDLGIADKDRINETLQCLRSCIDDLTSTFEDKLTFTNP